MTWTSAQCERIILRYGHDGEAYCPIDHTQLIFITDRLPGARPSRGALHCPCCGEQVGSTWLPPQSDAQPWLRQGRTHPASA